MRNCAPNIGLLLMIAIMVVVSSCRLTKFVPEDKELLYKTNVKVLDTKQVTGSELSSYLRQRQNTEILGFWKLQLNIYNTAPLDTTTKAKRRLAENAYKMGEAPVIYDEALTDASMEQLRKVMQNRGYFHASVDTTKTVKDRKVRLTYRVTAGEPYIIHDYKPELEFEPLMAIANHRSSLIQEDEVFNSDLMDEERQRITSAMRRRGYYYFDKSLLCYEADSSMYKQQVSLRMKMQDYVRLIPDSIKQRLYRQYTVSRVCFHMDFDLHHLPEDAQVTYENEPGYEYSYIGRRLLRASTLRKNCRIVPGELFDEAQVEQTYANLNGLGPVKYVDISFDPVGEDMLECHITISRNKLNTISAELEGTYSAGDWGIAAGVGYINKNIFRGAEQLSLRGRGSYEWRQNGGRAIEANAEAGLTFPTNVRLNIAYNYQKRPDEYTRTIANAGVYYSLKKARSRWNHTFNLVDISYIYLPWMSEQFKSDFLDKSSVLKTSYEDHFILDWGYRCSYSGQNPRQPYRSYANFSASLETAGNLLYGISKIANLPTNENDQYTIFKIPYAQYAKADVNFAYHHFIRPQHQMVYHVGVGVAVPYLNASVIPFEKRYFSGGSNSVRGWQARTLGPGAFRGNGNGLVYDLQAGDIRLDLNLEYRYKVLSFLELAAFLDAGNIWTIRDYEQQPYGVFRFSEFYKQLAFSYGVGVRLDFSILIFRVDFGVKLHDPTRLYGALAGTQWRTVANGLCWKDDMTFHFAIGYPF